MCKLVALLHEYLRRFRFEEADRFTVHVMEYLRCDDLKPVMDRGCSKNMLASQQAIEAALKELGFAEVQFQGLTEFVQEIDRDAAPATPPTVVTLPGEMTSAMREVLGLPTFMCAPFAKRLRTTVDLYIIVKETQ